MTADTTRRRHRPRSHHPRRRHRRRDLGRASSTGRSGARTMTFDWVEQVRAPGELRRHHRRRPRSEVLSKVEVRRLDPTAQYALIASREAWADAGSPEVEPERLGVAIGTGIGGVWTLLDQWDNLREKGPRRVFPLAVPMLMPNSPAGNVSLELGARAGAHTTVSACASGAEAMGYALEMIRTGRADVVVAGGTEARDPPAAHRRVRGHAGAVDAQRRARARLAALRHRPRRLRPGRGRRGDRARERGARQGPRRQDLRRARPGWACPPTPTTSRPRAGGRRRLPRHGRGRRARPA